MSSTRVKSKDEVQKPLEIVDVGAIGANQQTFITETQIKENLEEKKIFGLLGIGIGNIIL